MLACVTCPAASGATLLLLLFEYRNIGVPACRCSCGCLPTTSSWACSFAGDRTEESLLAFADTLAPTAGQPHYYIRGVNRVAKSTGCALSGFVLVKKVSGSLG